MHLSLNAGLACLLALVGPALTLSAGATSPAGTVAGARNAPPLARLPEWAVPSAYRLALTTDPAQSGYSGTVAIAVDLKHASNYLWLHGKGLQISSVTVTDAHGTVHQGSYVAGATPAAANAGVARINFGTTLPPQQITLRIAFTAFYNRTLQGYYKVVFAGNAYAITQMEPISARLAFPCFDEPGFKAPLTLALTIPDADKAIANAAESGSKPDGKGWKTLTFQTTRPLPTYLYAWMVGPWDIVQGPTIPPSRWRNAPIPLRGIAVKGKGYLLKRALAMVPAIIEHEEAYYGFGYPFGKLDVAALPDFAAGAMENAGLVTFRDWLLLLGPNPTPGALRDSFNDIAHEMAHQWTGDIVTPEWWNDIWLNEAFATWMQQKVAGEIHPDWLGHVGRVMGAEAAMQEDSRVTARAIRQPVTGGDDITNVFNGITYQKGAAVIAMFEHFGGPAVFQKGMRTYIKAHTFGNANADDLVDAIATAAGKGAAFKAAFKSFLDQNGVPLIATRLDCSPKGGAVLELTQSRYLPLGSAGNPDRLWGVPVCVRFPNGAQCQLLDAHSATMKIAGGKCPAWYMPNMDADGYYRFEMAKADRAALAKVIGARTEAEQLAYVDSTDAAFRRGDISSEEVLAEMRRLAASPLRQVALTPLATVAWIYEHAARTPVQKAAIRAAVAAAYLPSLERLGYHRIAGEPADAALMRSRLADWLALRFGVPTVRVALLKQGEAALQRTRRGLLNLSAADPDLLDAALAVAVEDLGKPAVDALIAAVPRTQDPVRRNAMLYALGHAQGSEAEVVRNFALSSAVKAGELDALLEHRYVAAGERVQQWQWLVAHYPQIVARLGVFAGRDLPRLAAGGDCSNAAAARVTTYFAPKLDQVPGLHRNVQQIHESIMLCSALKARQSMGVETR